MDVRKRNNITIDGAGPPIVFAHGFGCDQTMWKRVWPRFAPTNTVIRFDYVGAGGADRSAYDSKRYGSMAGYVADLLDVCRTLRLEKPIFVGHSVSTMIGLRAAAEASELFERMVLLAPSPCFVNDPPYVGGFERADIDGLLDLMDANFMGWADALSQMVLSVPDLARELRESFCRTDPQCLREFARVAFLTDSRAILPRVSTPCLVVQCTRDDIAPIVVGEYVAAKLPHATYRLADVPGHMPHMSHPDVVEAAIREYISIPTERLFPS